MLRDPGFLPRARGRLHLERAALADLQPGRLGDRLLGGSSSADSCALRGVADRRPAPGGPEGRASTRTRPGPGSGLEGERVDAASLGCSASRRTKAADLAAGGQGAARRRASSASPTGCRAGAWLEVDAAGPRRARADRGRARRGHADRLRRRRHRGGRQAGRRRRPPSPGWTGPTVIGGLAAAGYRISTSGAAERQGIVHRLDVGTSGLMVVAKSRARVHRLKRQFKRAHGRQDATTRWSRATPTRCAARSTRRSAATRSTTTSGPSTAEGKPSVTHYDLIEAFRARHPARHPAGDRPHPPDPGAHGRACATPASATSPTAPTRRSPSGSG